MPYYPPASGGGSLEVRDESVVQGSATAMDFVGAGVVASVAAGVATVTISGGGAGAFAVTQTEVSFGTTPKRHGSFNIASGAISDLQRMIISLAAEAPTGKGARADELEMDQITLMPERCTAGNCLVRWVAESPVKGNFKVNWSVA